MQSEGERNEIAHQLRLPRAHALQEQRLGDRIILSPDGIACGRCGKPAGPTDDKRDSVADGRIRDETDGALIGGDGVDRVLGSGGFDLLAGGIVLGEEDPLILPGCMALGSVQILTCSGTMLDWMVL